MFITYINIQNGNKIDLHMIKMHIQVLQREIPMDWGTTKDILTLEINPFLYARETKYLTLKDLNSYLIPGD